MFVCYDHDDATLVYPELQILHDDAVHVRYDEGISPGRVVGRASGEDRSRTVFLYFVTPQSVASSHCRRELSFALAQHAVAARVLRAHGSATRTQARAQQSAGDSRSMQLSDDAYRSKLTAAIRRRWTTASDPGARPRNAPRSAETRDPPSRCCRSRT